MTATHTVDHFHSTDFIRVDAFTVQVQLTPEEEEFLSHLVADVAINDCIPLVILVHHVEGLAVPDSQVEPLSVDDIIAEHSLQFIHFGF